MTSLEVDIESRITDISTDEKKAFLEESFNRVKALLHSLAMARDTGTLSYNNIDYIDLHSLGPRRHSVAKYIGNPFTYYKYDGHYFTVTFNGLIKIITLNDVCKYPLGGIVDLDKTLTIEFVEKQNALYESLIAACREFEDARKELRDSTKTKCPMENDDSDYIRAIWSDKDYNEHIKACNEHKAGENKC